MFLKKVSLKIQNNIDWYWSLPIKEANLSPKFKLNCQTKNALTIHAVEAKENQQFRNPNWPQNHQNVKSISWKMTNREKAITIFQQFRTLDKARQKAVKNKK
jgi:hypothetical protein